MTKVAIILSTLAALASAASLSTYLTTEDQDRLKGVFDGAAPYADAASAYYAIKGLSLLGLLPDNVKEACKKVQSFHEQNRQHDVEALFYTTSSANFLPSCKLEIGLEQPALRTAFKDINSLTGVYHAYFSLKLLGFSVDANDVSTTLKAALKKDDSALSHGYAFLVAADLPGEVRLFDLVDDIFAQADEVEEKYLQFEGGLQATSAILEGAYKLAEKAGKAPSLSADKVLKLANYLLSRKHVHRARNAVQLLSAVRVLTTNPFHVPVVITLAGGAAVSEQNPQVRIRASDLLGGPVAGISLVADSARHLSDDAVVLSKKPLVAAAGSDSTIFELDFSPAKAPFGFYLITVSAVLQKPDSRYIGTHGATIEVKVTTKVNIENVEVGVADKDQVSGPRTTRLQYPKKAASIIEADGHQRVVVTFSLNSASASKTFIRSHQAFVRLTNQKTKQEIVFVAVADDTNKQYKFDLDVGAKEKEFGAISGRYSLDLLIGDAIIENPLEWTVADVDLKFSGSASLQRPSSYDVRPEIKHMFREPEKRPPSMVSNLFTLLVTAPLLLVFVLWMKLGVNTANFSLSLNSVGFHGGLAAIFALYFCYFLKLNMFDTLRYLALIAVPTFWFGHRLLSTIAAKRKH